MPIEDIMAIPLHINRLKEDETIVPILSDEQVQRLLTHKPKNYTLPPWPKEKSAHPSD
jgi:hypothetical protein